MTATEKPQPQQPDIADGEGYAGAGICAETDTGSGGGDHSASAAITSATVRHAAMDFLARREYGLQELHARLLRRFPDPSLVTAVLEQLRSEGLQSDQRYAESQLRSQISRGRGPQRIRAELRQKGLDEALVESAIAELDVDWLELLRDVSRRKFGTSPPKDWQERARRARFFQYRGFDFDTIGKLQD
ncbi:MAG TPA: regulatory protein RecX [Spongiibacteraceae bacterium]|jgi:regulatory protein|nr:regulatory protein RecX [Spongiibacteraceae bacterium]HUH36463.1 regulatory protein RecX [Spongiibacteraceae bacterium]